MITTLIAWCGTTLGRYAIIGGGLLAFVGAYTWQQRSIGAERERNRIVNEANRVTKERAANAAKRRRAVPLSGASKRLRDEYGPEADQL